MKKKYCRVSTFLATLFSSIIAWFTTSSCQHIIPGRVEYGTPQAEFEVKATVISEENVPIEGLQVELLEPTTQKVVDREKTDSSGRAELEEDMLHFSNQERTVRVTDVDGAQNGLWETKEVTVRVKDSTIKKESRWRKEATQQITIRLEEKK